MPAFRQLNGAFPRHPCAVMGTLIPCWLKNMHAGILNGAKPHLTVCMFSKLDRTTKAKGCTQLSGCDYCQQDGGVFVQWQNQLMRQGRWEALYRVAVILMTLWMLKGCKQYLTIESGATHVFWLLWPWFAPTELVWVVREHIAAFKMYLWHLLVTLSVQLSSCEGTPLPASFCFLWGLLWTHWQGGLTVPHEFRWTCVTLYNFSLTGQERV